MSNSNGTVQLKPISEQRMVITGATSGIGLVSARMAAQRGARVVLAARNREALEQLEAEIAAQGGACISVVCDVGVESEVREISRRAVEAFGGFDTWVNNAGVSIYGTIEQISLEDARRLFDTNFWGVVYGSRVALEHLREHGGALINLGSTVSDRAIPLQGIYSASKHAVKGFTDALRMELEHERAPVSVTLIKPGAIDTPYSKHAKNYLDVEPKFPPPVYAPENVAEAILCAAEHPIRDIMIGAGGKGISLLGKYAPRMADKIMEKTMFSGQRTDTPAEPRRDSLHEHGEDLQERGGHAGHVTETSMYTKATLHPYLSGVVAVGVAGVVLAAWRLAGGSDAFR